MIDDLLGQRAGIGFALFGKDHRGIRLIVTEAQVCSGGDSGGGGFSENGGERGAEAGFEGLKKSHDAGDCKSLGNRMVLGEGFAIKSGEDFSGAGRGFEAAADFAVGKHLGDGGQGL